MPHEYITFAEIMARNRMSKEFAKSLKNNSPVSAPILETITPVVEATAPIAIPNVPAIELPNQETTIVSADPEFPIGKAILTIVVVAGIGYGLHLWYKNYKKNKDQKSKESDFDDYYKHSGVGRYLTGNYNTKHYSTEEIMNMPDQHPMTTFMPLTEDKANYYPKKRVKRTINTRIRKPVNLNTFNNNKYTDEDYSPNKLSA